MFSKAIFTCTAALLAQSIQAQECAQHYPLVKDFSFEMQHYRKASKKGSNYLPNGKVVHTVQQVESTTSGKKAVIETVRISEKGKRGVPITYTVECNAGVVKIDTRAAMRDTDDPSTSYGNYCFIELPSQPEVGMALGECTFTCLDKKNNRFAKIDILDRKITAKESITIASGTFEAFVIEYEMRTTYTQGFTVMFIKHHKDWYVTGKGFVRTENFRPSSGTIKNEYNPGDQPLHYSELTATH
jgi:hypothetical protein